MRQPRRTKRATGLGRAVARLLGVGRAVDCDAFEVRDVVEDDLPHVSDVTNSEDGRVLVDVLPVNPLVTDHANSTHELFDILRRRDLELADDPAKPVDLVITHLHFHIRNCHMFAPPTGKTFPN